jgi:hypothetical protein
MSASGVIPIFGPPLSYFYTSTSMVHLDIKLRI